MQPGFITLREGEKKARRNNLDLWRDHEGGRKDLDPRSVLMLALGVDGGPGGGGDDDYDDDDGDER